MAKKQSTKQRREAAASDFVPVQAILPPYRSGDPALIVIRDASFRAIVQAGQVNWDQKSSGERAGIVSAWGEMVDSLEPRTPLEVVVLSRELDPTAYIRQYDEPFRSGRLTEPLLHLGLGHVQHAERLVKGQNLLAREVYFVLTSKGAARAVRPRPSDQIPLSRIWEAMGKRTDDRSRWRSPTNDQINAAYHDLSVRCDQLRSQLEQIGVWSKPLGEDDVKQLLNGLFNPGKANLEVGFEATPHVELAATSEQRRRPIAAAPVMREIEAPRFRH